MDPVCTPHVLHVLKFGVESGFKGDLRIKDVRKTPEEEDLAMKVMEEYVQVGAAKLLPPEGTKFLVPWFVVEKVDEKGDQKLRLISDCREINRF